MTYHKFTAIPLFGPHLAGKGHVARYLTKTYENELVSVGLGELMRKEIELRSERGMRFEQYVRAGALVPSDDALSFFKETIDSIIETHNLHPDRHVFVLDGMPRDANQVKALYDMMFIGCVLNFTNIPDFEILRRAESRLNKAQRNGQLPRIDDPIDVVRARLESYKKDTLPALDWLYERLQGKGREIPIYGIDALRGFETVERQIDRVIGTYMARWRKFKQRQSKRLDVS